MKQLEPASKEELERVKAELRELPYGTTIKTILRHCSRSGMMRIIDMTYVKDDMLCHVWIRDPKNFFGVVNDQVRGYKVGGCGMDMGFHLVYSLGSYIWRGHEDELRKKCIEAEKEIKKNDKDRRPYVHDSLTSEKPYGGYYFKQEWL